MKELFSNILDAIRDNLAHLGNADPTTLIVIACAVALVVYFLLRR